MLVPLREAINDSPGEGEFEAYSPERIRGYERSLELRRQTPYTIVARHRATGAPAGITMLCVHELRPAIAAQEDTSVLAAHRGHRLGLRMKLAMLDWLRLERPDVESVDTWNAPGNAPMIAINEALGCRKVAEAVRFTKSGPRHPAGTRLLRRRSRRRSAERPAPGCVLPSRRRTTATTRAHRPAGPRA